jgi:class 3 adenylate cyclase
MTDEPKKPKTSDSRPPASETEVRKGPAQQPDGTVPARVDPAPRPAKPTQPLKAKGLDETNAKAIAELADRFRKIAWPSAQPLTQDWAQVFRQMSATPSLEEILHRQYQNVQGQPVTGVLDKYNNLSRELQELKEKADRQVADLIKEKSGAEQKILNLQQTLDEVKRKEKLQFILSRVNRGAQEELLKPDSELRSRFLQEAACKAFVMSVDIRRSTELMLKAREPQAFADFITSLCSELMEIIQDSYGVFDKFTGDGVLAFFPDFYSGIDAPYLAVKAADRCHASFRDHYKRLRGSFTSILKDVGLGIGIDFGSVHLVQIAGGLTVVGAPVVYACRLSAAPPGMTLVNQPAYEVISERCGEACFIDESEIEIKHEGRLLAYEARLGGRPYQPQSPDWSSVKDDIAGKQA